MSSFLAVGIALVLVVDAGCGDDARCLPLTSADGGAAGQAGDAAGGRAQGGGGGAGGAGAPGAAGGQSGGSGIPLDELGSQSRASICAYAVRCGVFPDLDTCQATIYERLQVFADVGAGKVLYDGQAATACVDWYTVRGCTVSDLETPAPSCGLIFTGTLPEGSACLAGNQCLSDTCNRAACGPDACCAGLCELPVAVGGDCSQSGKVCAHGAFCKSDATGSHASCAPRVLPGASCDSSDLCVPGQFCAVDPLTGRGLCAGAPSEGQACPTGFCGAITDTCDPNSSLCIAKRPVGAACFTDRTCVNYARCDPDTSTCVARVHAGAACAVTADCIAGLPCQGGICVPPRSVPACP